MGNDKVTKAQRDIAKRITAEKVYWREAQIDRSAYDADKRTVELAFSSELPVERWFGNEILDHSPQSVDLSRMANGAALLVNHDAGDQVGVVESARIDSDRKGRAVVRFSRSARGEEIAQDVADGIRRSVSVGYRVLSVVLEKQDEQEGDTYRITRWQPMEVSIVAVPADATVGVGRSADSEAPEPPPPPPAPTQPEPEQRTEPAKPTITVTEPETAHMDEAIKTERARVAEIMALGKTHKMVEDAERACAADTTVDQFRAQVLEKLGKVKPVETKPDLGMSKKEIRAYSFHRAVQAALDNDWSNAGLEREAWKAAEKQMGRTAKGFLVPHDVLAAPQFRTAANVTTDAQGGYLVATDHLAGSFIDLLRNNTVTVQAGVQMMGGLVGDVAIPKLTSGATAYWLGETTDVTESTLGFGQATLTPKNVGALLRSTRSLMKQSSPDIEQIMRSDLVATLAIAIDAAVLQGSGSANQPTGITSLGGSVNTVAFGGAVTWGKVVDMVTAVAADKVPLVRPAYIGSPQLAGAAMQTEKTSGNALYIMDSYDKLNGFPFYTTTNCTSTNLFFGNWNDAIVGMWGGLDILVDPYTYSASGGVRIIAFQTLDIAVRRDVSFCYSTGLTV